MNNCAFVGILALGVNDLKRVVMDFYNRGKFDLNIQICNKAIVSNDFVTKAFCEKNLINSY